MDELPKPERIGAIITLCGSTRFKKHFEMYAKELTLAGWLVISLSCFAQSDDEHHRIYEAKEMLNRIHLKKIDLSEAIFVLNIDGYIGHSTHTEIVYASANGKKMYFAVPDYDPLQTGLRSYQEG